MFSMWNEKLDEKQRVLKNIGGRLTAVCLIGSVLTVVLLIARPAHRNAAATGAGEEVDGTFKLSLVCKRSGGRDVTYEL